MPPTLIVTGALIDTLHARAMYDNTLVVLSSDNGGPIGLAESGSNNWPLRGGKYADLEGGVRATAFISGGLVPAALRGTSSSVVMHIADWCGHRRASKGMSLEQLYSRLISSDLI